MFSNLKLIRVLVFAFALLAAAVTTSANADFLKGFNLSEIAGPGDDVQLLPDAEAFQIIKSEVREGQLTVQWLSAPDYYLYRQNFKIVSDVPGVTIGEMSLPKGKVEDDPLFGPVEVYFDEVAMVAPISFSGQAEDLTELQLKIHAQGCNKPVGICYPPQVRDVFILLNDINNSPAPASFIAASPIKDIASTVESSATAPTSVSRSVDQAEAVGASFWSYVLTAFGAGLLLVFTPCVLPMLPILSGLIVGSDDKPVSRARAGSLSIAYVLGTAITYTAMGALAGAAGIQLQAYFQHPAAIITMVIILLVLALSMFGAFSIALPSGAQSKLSQWSDKFKSGSLFLVMIMGLLSALIVSACVSPLLITALGVAIQKGDPWLGASMMFAMAMGMGVFLIAFGFGASWLVPKAGAWMNRVKEFFGFLVLAVAIIVASSIKEVPLLLLWSALLLGIGFWLWQIAKETEASGKVIVFNVIAAMSFLWGAAAFVGGLTGSQQITQPLSKITNGGNSYHGAVISGVPQEMSFKKVTSVAQIEALLQDAKTSGKPVLVDYYADWCTDCKRMDAGTYSEAEVITAFSSWQLIKIDVTKVNDESQAAKDFYSVFGPPATLFIDGAGNELKNLRRYGYIKKREIMELANQVSSSDITLSLNQ